MLKQVKALTKENKKGHGTEIGTTVKKHENISYQPQRSYLKKELLQK